MYKSTFALALIASVNAVNITSLNQSEGLFDSVASLAPIPIPTSVDAAKAAATGEATKAAAGATGAATGAAAAIPGATSTAPGAGTSPLGAATSAIPSAGALGGLAGGLF